MGVQSAESPAKIVNFAPRQAGGSSAAANYPSQLAEDLRERFPGHDITVLNRGVNGEETDNMMARFASDVIAAHPTADFDSKVSQPGMTADRFVGQVYAEMKPRITGSSGQ